MSMFSQRKEGAGLPEFVAGPANAVGLAPAQMIPAPERHALLLVGIHEQTWMPSNGQVTPTKLFHNIGAKFRAEFVQSFNSQPEAASSRQLAVLLSRGGVYMWHDVPDSARPVDPLAFPLTAEGPLTTFAVAHAECIRRNDEIVKVARVPRVWWIVIHDVAAAMESNVSNLAAS